MARSPLAAAALAAAMLFAAGPAGAQPAPAGAVHAVRFGQLWDGVRTVKDAVVVVRDGRIVSVDSGPGAVPAGAEVVDLRRYTGLPGLIDLHTHITYHWDRTPGTRPRGGPRKLPAVTVFMAQENARKTLETGVTTARDLGAQADTDFAMRELIASGAMVGPRLLVAGAGISAARTDTTPDPALREKQAIERIEKGADWVKVYASRGSFESVEETQTLPYEDLKAIVDAAHARKIKVAVHSYGPSGVRDAVRAGADSVEHGVDLDDATLAEMKARGTVWVPTIDHNRYYVDAKDEFGFPADAIAPLEGYIARNLAATRRAAAAGVRLGMGSDAVYTMFGQNTRELGWFVKAGMTPAQALATATTIPAELLGMGDRLGRVSPGFLADLVAVEGDPLASIDALFTGVRWVMKDGAVVVDRRTAGR